MMQIISRITPGSIAEELDILPGSRLLSVNGEQIEDMFDYQFLISDGYVELEVESPDGEVDIYEIEKGYDEDIGLEFENSLMDEYRSCSNHCIFCFIDQMPAGMRETLYFKDDDSRLSFLQGNYVTLTNMKQEDVDRIIRYRMSPINISVHTTNPELRCRMLHNRKAGEVLSYLDQLCEAQIRMNGQIVLCRGINDGEELKRTIADLSRYAPMMESVSVVPVGLTRYREGLYPLEPIRRQDAEQVIDLIEAFQRQIYQEQGIHFVHASDEFYLLAEREVPEEERYDGYLQLENGVGMLRLLREEFEEALTERLKVADDRADKPDALQAPEESMSAAAGHPDKRTITIATGKLSCDTIRQLVTDGIRRLYQAGILRELPRVDCVMIDNHFFGERITVSGLICGCDIIEQLKNRDLGEELLLPVNMMRSGERYFLDDITVSQVEQELKVRVVIVPSDGASLLKAILGEKIKAGGRQIYEQADRGDCWQT